MPTWTVTRCRGSKCGRPIVFLKTAAGRVIPVDYNETVTALDDYYVFGRHVPHHSTCPSVDEFRKKKGRSR